MIRDYFNGESVELHEILKARDKRQERQQKMLSSYGNILICLTLNIAGPVKYFPMAEKTIKEGIESIKASLACERIPVMDHKLYLEKTGCEAYFSVDGHPEKVKRLMVRIEDTFPLGRLLDIDVLTSDGKKMERGHIGMEARTCFLCSKPAAQCGRSRTHSLEELIDYTQKTMLDFFLDKFSDKAARLAARSLLYELSVTPKPGLVDRANNGAHKDMDFFTFIDSSLSLLPFFKSCVKTGFKQAERPDDELFSMLRPDGILAEKLMLKSTKGVNTHKGAIFSLGLICASIGRIQAFGDPMYETRVCSEVEKLAKYSLSDYELKPLDGLATGGELAFAKFKITGARGEAASGFWGVLNIALPELRRQLKLGRTINDAGLYALLSLMSFTDDTNVVKRSGRQTLKDMQDQAKNILRQDIINIDEVENLDKDLIEKNISPGGCADLLAITYFLYFLSSEPDLLDF